MITRPARRRSYTAPLFTAVAAGWLLAVPAASAQEEDQLGDDVLDDILSGPDDTVPQTVGEERAALMPEPSTEELPPPPPPSPSVPSFPYWHIAVVQVPLQAAPSPVS